MPPNAIAAAAALILVPSAALATVHSGQPSPSSSATFTTASTAPRTLSATRSGASPPQASARWLAGVPTDAGRLTPSGRVTGWRWPLSTRPAVLRRFFVGPHRWSAGHRGVDLAASAGSHIRAPAAGVVTFARSVVDRPVLVITHAGGIRTAYEPVLPAVPSGTAVAPGMVVGRLVASAGHCPPRACLHWSARRGDRYVDPLSLLATPRIALLPVPRASPPPDG